MIFDVYVEKSCDKSRDESYFANFNSLIATKFLFFITNFLADSYKFFLRSL